MLRDRLVCGIAHQQWQKRLLSEEGLTHNRAVKLLVSMEAAQVEVGGKMKAKSTSSATSRSIVEANHVSKPDNLKVCLSPITHPKSLRNKSPIATGAVLHTKPPLVILTTPYSTIVIKRPHCCCLRNQIKENEEAQEHCQSNSSSGGNGFPIR